MTFKGFTFAVLGTLLTLCRGDSPALQGDKAKADSEALKLLRDAANLATQVDDPRDRTLVYTQIGEIAWKSGDHRAATISFDKALELIDVLPPDKNYAVDRDTNRAAIGAGQAQIGDIEGAKRTLAQIKDDSLRSTVLFDIALAQAHTADFSNAVRTASQITDSNNRDELLKMIANQQLKAGDIQNATKLANTIETAAHRAEALTYIAAEQAKQGNSHEAARESGEAIRLASQSEDVGTSSLTACSSEEPPLARDAVLQGVAEMQASSGDISGASETLDHITSVTSRENVLVNIAEAQTREGNLSGAQITVTAINRDACRAAALNGIARVLFDAGNVSGALAIARTITEPGERVASLTYVGKRLLDEHQFSSALEVFRNAREASGRIADAHERAGALEEMAEMQARAGSRMEAAQTLAEAAPVALAAYQEARRGNSWSAAFPNLVVMQVGIGDAESAWSNLASLEVSDRMWVVQNAAMERTKTDNQEGAFAWAARQTCARDKALALIGIAEGLLSPK